MKKKLEETGKSCLYKNFDLLPTKVNTLSQLFLNVEIVTRVMYYCLHL